MIPLKKDVEVQISDDFETADFTMTASPEAFAATIDTLYEDKIGSPLREYMTNAADSHVQAGHKKNFEVVLPTALEPKLAVKDFGTGLSREQITTHLTCLFSTSKKDTNKQTGYLGLGSKSLFAYTDSATVISRQGGTQWTYMVSRKDSGIPQITLTSETPTDLPDGLEISYPVRQDDINKFKEAARWLLFGFEGFPVQPKFNMVIEPTFDKSSLIFETESVQFYNVVHGNARVYVRQGPVLYPLRTQPQWLNYDHTVIVNVPIGTVAVATNRETLSLGDKTQKVIDKLLDDAEKEVRSSIEKVVNASENYVEACKNHLGKFRFIRGDASYKGKAITSHYRYTFPGKTLVKNRPSYTGSTRSIQLYIANLDTTKFVYLLDGAKEPTLMDSRFMSQYNANDTSYIYYLFDVTKANLKQIQKDLGLRDDQLIDISKLPEPPAVPKTTRRRYRSPGLTPNATKDLKPYTVSRKHTYGSIDWTQTDVPADGEYYWLQVRQKGGTIEWPYDKDGHGAGWLIGNIRNDLLSYMTSLPKDPFVQKPILLMTATVQDALNPPKDKRLDEVMKKITKKNLRILVATSKWAHGRSRIYGFGQLAKIGLVKEESVMTCWDSSEKSWVNRLLNMVGVYEKTAKEAEDFYTGLKAKYPLAFETSRREDLLAAYIKLVDEAEKVKTTTKGKVNVKV